MVLHDELKRRHDPDQLESLLSIGDLPDLNENFVEIDASSQGAERAANLSLNLINYNGGKTKIYVSTETKLSGFRLNLNNVSDSLVIFGKGCNLSRDTTLSIEGPGHTMCFGGGQQKQMSR